MSTKIPDEAPTREHSESVHPFRPSWIDRFLRWMERLPVPVSVVLIGIWIVLVATVHLTVWHEGILAQWQLDQRILLINTWIPYSLGFMFYLERTAARALIDFRPALDIADDVYSTLRYEFTVMPNRGVLASMGLGALLTYITLRMFPETSRPFMDTPLAAVVNMTLSMLAAAFTLAAIYLTYRQLRLIRQTYALANRLYLFRSGELYAFSGLTLRMGIGWLLVIYAGMVFYPALARNIPWMASVGLVLAGVAISLVTTLFDIHKRIDELKAEYLGQVNTRLQAAFIELHRKIDARELDELASLRAVMDALLVERGVVEKIPTWPWQPGTLASFLAAVFLPLIVWAAQLLLQRLLSL